MAGSTTLLKREICALEGLRNIHGPKPYKFIRSGDIHGPTPYTFIWFGDIRGPKPYKFIRFGDLHGPKPYQFIGFGHAPSVPWGGRQGCRPTQDLPGPVGLCRDKIGPLLARPS